MIDTTENNQESISDMLTKGNKINDEDLNNLCYIFQELLEASLCIQYEIEKEAKHQGNMHLQIYTKGFESIITECHKEYLKIKKQNKWDNNIGEEYK